MLILTRKIDETILIGDDIEIMLVDIRGDRCRIGIKAPRDVHILRGELEAWDDSKALSSIGDNTSNTEREIHDSNSTATV